MSWKKKRNQGALAKATYQCPGCGEMVGKQDIEAIREHHQHVLRAMMNTFVTLPFVPPAPLNPPA